MITEKQVKASGTLACLIVFGTMLASEGFDSYFRFRDSLYSEDSKLLSDLVLIGGMTLASLIVQMGILDEICKE